MDNFPLVDCAFCDGAGKVPLSDELVTLLGKIRAVGQGASGDFVIEGHSRTWRNNQLELLRKHGFLRRVKKSRQWIYTPVETKTNSV